MNKSLRYWLAFALWMQPLIACAHDLQGPAIPWLEAVKVGIEKYAAANDGKIPVNWDDIVACNKRGIERATTTFVNEQEYSPLESYGLFPNGLPLPDHPSELIILVRTSPLIRIWKNADGQLERTPFRHLIFRNNEGKILIGAQNESALTSIKSHLDVLQALDASKGLPSEQTAVPAGAISRDDETAKRADISTVAQVEPANLPHGSLSYTAVGIISILSAAIGSAVVWWRCRA